MPNVVKTIRLDRNTDGDSAAIPSIETRGEATVFVDRVIKTPYGTYTEVRDEWHKTISFLMNGSLLRPIHMDRQPCPNVVEERWFWGRLPRGIAGNLHYLLVTRGPGGRLLASFDGERADILDAKSMVGRLR